MATILEQANQQQAQQKQQRPPENDVEKIESGYYAQQAANRHALESIDSDTLTRAINNSDTSPFMRAIAQYELKRRTPPVEEAQPQEQPRAIDTYLQGLFGEVPDAQQMITQANAPDPYQTMAAANIPDIQQLLAQSLPYGVGGVGGI